MPLDYNRKIRLLAWEGDEVTHPPRDGYIKLENCFHGAYDLDWAVAYDKDGKERARHNVMRVSSIVWEDE